MKTVYVNEVHGWAAWFAQYGITEATLPGLAIAGAVLAAALFATLTYRWI